MYTHILRDIIKEATKVDQDFIPDYKGDAVYYTDVDWDWRKFLIDYTENEVEYNLSSGVPYIPSNVTSSSSGYHTQTWIQNVPDYLNYDDISCVPTATAMIMAYYDNEYRDSWTSFDIGDYPLLAELSGGYEI